jgi:hypothetical protein
LPSQRLVRSVQVRRNRPGPDTERLGDRAVVEVGVVPQEECDALAFR